MYSPFGGNSPFVFNNNAISEIPSMKMTAQDACIYNGQFTMLGTDTLNPIKILKMYNGSTSTTFHQVPLWMNEIQTFNTSLFGFTQANFPYNGMNYNNAMQLDSLSIINGVVYIDANSNCLLDSTENILPQTLVHFSSGTAALSNINGEYQEVLVAGNVSIDSISGTTGVSKNFQLNCHSFNPILLGVNQHVTQNLGVINSVATDLVVSLAEVNGFQARLGFQEKYVAMVSNAGNTTQNNCNLTIQIPSSLVIDSISPSGGSIAGNTVTYALATLSPANSKTYYVYAYVNPTQNALGDTLISTAFLNQIAGDTDLNDNADTLTQVVITSYDPNDKMPNKEAIHIGENSIDYHIRFQNTGNDTAFRVVVVDSIQQFLNPTTIKINATSHPCSFRIDGDVFIWEFDNIQLPDSTTDEAKSHGFINFSLQANSSLRGGDTIKNFTDIFFDFQPPIRTNTAKTVFVSGIGLAENNALATNLIVYPNPTQQAFFVKNTTAENINFAVTDQLGRTLLTRSINAYDEIKIESTLLAAGIYFVTSGSTTLKIIIK